LVIIHLVGVKYMLLYVYDFYGVKCPSQF
jgi:hypothetical protein